MIRKSDAKWEKRNGHKNCAIKCKIKRPCWGQRHRLKESIEIYFKEI
jgi:hypothetical protein